MLGPLFEREMSTLNEKLPSRLMIKVPFTTLVLLLSVIVYVPLEKFKSDRVVMLPATVTG